MGKQRRTADPGERSHNIFLEERRERGRCGEEDLYFHENSPNYPAEERQGKGLQDTHEVRTMNISGTMLGFPYDRKRAMTCGWVKKKFKWMGEADHEAEFRRLFERSVQTNGDIYFMAGESETRLEYQRLASLRGHSLLPEHIDLEDPECASKILCPGAAMRIQEYAACRKEHESLDGVYLADIDHHPGSRGPGAGPYYPTMDTHAVVYSFSQKRIHLGLEQFGVHGIHVYPQTMKKWHCPFKDTLAKLPTQHQRFLVGNSMLCPVVAAWAFYILSNLQPLDVPTKMPPQLRDVAADDDDDADDLSEHDQDLDLDALEDELAL
jgi:hypothetical protein